MKKQSLVLPVLLASLLAAVSAQAATSTELKIVGNIIPAACNADFGSTNEVHFGDIPAKNLSATQYTTLTEKEVTLTLSCEAAAKMAITLEDNRSDSRVAGIVGNNENHNFGLGMHKQSKIGGYTVSIFANPTLDLKQRNNLTSTNKNKWNWMSKKTELSHTNQYISFGSPDEPEPFKVLTAKFGIKPTLNKTTALPITEKIPLDGSVTVTLVYL